MPARFNPLLLRLAGRSHELLRAFYSALRAGYPALENTKSGAAYGYLGLRMVKSPYVVRRD